MDSRDRPEDDILDRATRALRETPVPEEADAQETDRLLAACLTAVQKLGPGYKPETLQDSSQPAARHDAHVPTELADGVSREIHPIEQPPGRRHVARRFVAMFHSRKARWSVAAGIAAAIVLAVGLWQRRDSHRGIVLGTVIDQVRSAGTVQFRLSHVQEGKPGRAARYLTKGTWTRIEFDDGRVAISHGGDPRILTLMPAQKKAILETRPTEESSKTNGQTYVAWFQAIKALQDRPDRHRRLLQLDGRSVLAFQTEENGIQITILADARTKRPVRIDMHMPLFRTTMTMSDFAFDAELDDSLFSLEPPVDWSVATRPQDGQANLAGSPIRLQSGTGSETPATKVDVSRPTEADVVKYVRLLAEENGGVFPSMEQLAESMRTRASRVPKAGKAATPEDQRLLQEYAEYVMKQVRASAYLRSINASQPMPIGSGVKLGDATRPVFMWGMPDQRHVRVIYGDLSVRELEQGSPEFKAIVTQMNYMHQERSTSMPARKNVPASRSASLGPGGIASLPWYGVRLAEAADRSGLLINAVYTDSPANSPAIAAGLHAGDVITHINGQPASTKAQANAFIQESRPGDHVTLTIRRGTAQLKVPLVVGHWPEHSKVSESLPAEAE